MSEMYRTPLILLGLTLRDDDAAVALGLQVGEAAGQLGVDRTTLSKVINGRAADQPRDGIAHRTLARAVIAVESAEHWLAHAVGSTIASSTHRQALRVRTEAWPGNYGRRYRSPTQP